MRLLYTDQCSGVQFSVVQSSAVQCSAVQCSALQHRAVAFLLGMDIPPVPPPQDLPSEGPSHPSEDLNPQENQGVGGGGLEDDTGGAPPGPALLRLGRPSIGGGQ